MAAQAAFVGWVTYAVYRANPHDLLTPIGVFFLFAVLCAFLTAILTRAWDNARFRPARFARWLVAILAFTAAVTGAVHFLGDDRGEWPLVFIMVGLASSLASIVVVPLLKGLLTKIGQPGSEGGRLGSPGSRGAQRLKHRHGLGVGEDAR